jgi:hypothetical protein
MQIRTWTTVAVLLCVAALPSRPACASLSGPPPSFVVPTSDGEHLFVMLSFVPIAQDEGNVCTLPNGKQVELRSTFPSSGLYKVGSRTPIWTVPWYGEAGYVILSEDGRYMVCVNRFGGGSLGLRDELDWGIIFFDSGIEIRRYNVGELVDYPSLMASSMRDWHLIWIDKRLCDREIRGRLYHLGTSCRERYAFDVTTGRIVEESRFWRGIAHRVYAVFVVAGFVGVWLIYRVRKARRATARKQSAQDDCIAASHSNRWYQFSLRSLMLMTTLTAVLCSLFSIVPRHFVIVFIVSVFFALLLTHVLRKRRRQLVGRRATVASRATGAILWTVVLASWFWVYMLSSTPVMVLTSPRHLAWSHDTRSAIAHGVYAPLYWPFIDCGLYKWRPAQEFFGYFFVCPCDYSADFGMSETTDRVISA